MLERRAISSVAVSHRQSSSVVVGEVGGVFDDDDDDDDVFACFAGRSGVRSLYAGLFFNSFFRICSRGRARLRGRERGSSRKTKSLSPPARTMILSIVCLSLVRLL